MLAKSDNAIDNLIDVDFVPYRRIHWFRTSGEPTQVEGFYYEPCLDEQGKAA